jgi:putative SOS response-associated peptidase YedK
MPSRETKSAVNSVAMKDGYVRSCGHMGKLETAGNEEWVRTFAIITTTANELVSAIHDRMPVILHPDDHDRWLSNIEPDPRDLLVPYPAEPMTMWPISTRVNKPENDEPAILDRAPEPIDWQSPLDAQP